MKIVKFSGNDDVFFFNSLAKLSFLAEFVDDGLEHGGVTGHHFPELVVVHLLV